MRLEKHGFVLTAARAKFSGSRKLWQESMLATEFKKTFKFSMTRSSNSSKPGRILDRIFWQWILWQRPADKANDFFSTVGAEVWETNRRIRPDILSHTSSVSHLTVQLVLVNAVRASWLADVASAARKHQAVVGAVFFRIKQVGAVAKQRC